MKKLGARTQMGTLAQLDILSQAARNSDGVIHTAFIHGFQHLNLAAKIALFAGALTKGIMPSFFHTLVETETRSPGPRIG